RTSEFVKTSDISTKPGGSPLSQDRKRHQPHGRVHLEAANFADTGDGGADEAAAVEAEPTPTPTPEKHEEAVTEVIVFEQTTVEDPALPRGQTQVTTVGQNGTRTLTYAVTTLEGVETGRELVSDVVTVAPIAQVTSVGTYDPPPPPAAAPVAPAAPANSGCDSNYAEACVPIASDVDCAGGSGNGPAYFDGVARVVGNDIYELDRDGDGYACEPW
ncbi:G5 domain-containing protein, partial [Microbacterium sp.]|uniref:G5 domain-containing protein n=1 Tax=Microbacterium sp. TaxID=51671 RepID=UPI003F6F981B